MNIALIKIMIAGSLIAAAGGLLGSFALLRRLALVGDALSHVALPGIALGLLFHFNVFLGSAAFLFVGTFAIWTIEHKTKLPVDTLVGIFFTLALAIGALLTPQTEILEALFGDITKITSMDFIIASIFSLVVIILLLLFYKKFILTMISPDLSLSTGVKPHRLELLFLMIFALTVAIGIKFAGALLTGSLVVIPAAAARNFAPSMKWYMALSLMLGFIGAAGAIFFAHLYNVSPGPFFIISAAIIFFISIFFKR